MKWRTTDRVAADRVRDRGAGRPEVPVGAVPQAVEAVMLEVAEARQRAVAAAALVAAPVHRATQALVAAAELEGPEEATHQAAVPVPVCPEPAGAAARILVGHQVSVLAVIFAKVICPAAIAADRIHVKAVPTMLAAKTVLMAPTIVEAHRPLCGTQVPRARLALADDRAT